MEEIWKNIQEYEGIYQISNLGRIKAVQRKVRNSSVGGFRNLPEKILKTRIENGYYSLTLNKGVKQLFICIHRLVAIAFIPNPENKRCVNHLDGNKLNNNVNNLKWSTHSENEKHAYQIGLKISHRVSINQGEKSSFSKLKENQVIEIYYLNEKRKELAKKYNVNQSSIDNIKNKKTWKHILNKI